MYDNLSYMGREVEMLYVKGKFSGLRIIINRHLNTHKITDPVINAVRTCRAEIK